MFKSLASSFATLPNNLQGASWMFLSALAFTAMAGIAKHLGSDLHAFQVSFFRSLFSLIVISPFLLKAGKDQNGVTTKVPLLQLVRGTVSALGIMMGFYAIINMPLADAQAIRFSSSLFLVPLAVIFLNEKVGPRRSVATLIGFSAS